MEIRKAQFVASLCLALFGFFCIYDYYVQYGISENSPIKYLVLYGFLVVVGVNGIWRAYKGKE